MKTCKCGCHRPVNSGKRFVTGHNLKLLKKTSLHRRHIAESQRQAWRAGRKRLPIGSTNRDCHGYIRVKVMEGSGRWDKQHVLVVEKQLGRKLDPHEVVHHINGIKDDNRTDNLHVCSRSVHSQLERDASNLLKMLLVDGLVVFNRKTSRYEKVLQR